ncbi:MAG: hypothetical protein NNA24_04925, partial [Nitrospira sp.]|nr:hypothetical protein [Nitrospira sp.]
MGVRSAGWKGRVTAGGTVLAVSACLLLSLGAQADDRAMERPGFALITRDGSGSVGRYSSVAIGADGLGLISYYDETNGDLKVAHCSNPACTSATISTLDDKGNVGLYTSLAIGADDLGLITYYDQTNGDLKVAHCADVACTAATLTALDRHGDVGQYTSVTIGTDGLPLITYYDVTKGDLKAAHCSDVVCRTATITTLTFLQAEEDVGRFTSVTIAGGQPLISYYDVTDQYLKSALCPDIACTEPTLTTTPDKTGNVGRYSSIVMGMDARPLIGYYDETNGDLKVIHCTEVLCITGTRTVLDGDGDVGQSTSITIGADGLGFISYYDKTNGDLKVAHCADTTCTTARIKTVDQAGDVGQDTSVTIGTDGFPLITYYDVTNGDLKVA